MDTFYESLHKTKTMSSELEKIGNIDCANDELKLWKLLAYKLYKEFNEYNFKYSAKEGIHINNLHIFPSARTGSKFYVIISNLDHLLDRRYFMMDKVNLSDPNSLYKIENVYNEMCTFIMDKLNGTI